ncbi:MAG: dockerin type I domain-containing protein, partial [Phycisphaerales bacterium]
SDADGPPDCYDGCPTDPNKTEPGTCGCGVADTDTDSDGTPDCNDGCPADPNKTEPGVCGCGVADTDTDGDGVADCIDNCPDLSNPSQADCDLDGIGDVCAIADGAADCNDNGIPDSCDIADGTSADANDNGVPDSCEEVVVVNVPGDYATIGDALAAVENGAVIEIEPGTYPGPIELAGLSVTLQGVDGAEVILDGAGLDGPVVTVLAPDGVAGGSLVVFKHIVVRGGSIGTVVDGVEGPIGGGIAMVNASLRLEDCVVESNSAGSGGAIGAVASTLVLLDSQVRDNVATNDGGALFAKDSDVAVENTTLSGNIAGDRGGAIGAVGGELLIEICVFESNTASAEGGAIAWSGGGFGASILDSEIRLNSGSIGGGIWIGEDASTLEIGDSVVCDNEPNEIEGGFTDLGGNEICGACLGDLNADGQVDGADLAAILGSWGVCGGGDCAVADVNGDGTVDGADLAAVLGNWGVCAP